MCGITKREPCFHCTTRQARRASDRHSKLTSLGFLIRHNSTNSLNALEKSPSRDGGLALGIKNSTRIGWYSASGGSPLAISMAVIPNDQISALESYPACLITSGAIQNYIVRKGERVNGNISMRRRNLFALWGVDMSVRRSMNLREFRRMCSVYSFGARVEQQLQSQLKLLTVEIIISIRIYVR